MGYKSTPDCVIVYGMQTKFGGGSTTGFANVYDSLDYLKKNEIRFRQVRAGLADKIEKKARAQRRQLKNRKKKVKGTKKDSVGGGKNKCIFCSFLFKIYKNFRFQLRT